MGSRKVTICGLCADLKFPLTGILDLGLQPLAERESPLYPLQLLQCENCSLIQLSCVVDEAERFPPEHPYATGNTRALREHFAALAATLPDEGTVVDIGANDGTFLSYVSGLERTRIAVEPTNQAIKCHDKGFITIQGFFTCDMARRIADEHGPAAVVVATNVLAHVPRPHDFVAGVNVLLGGQGMFITENHDAASILQGLQIDSVYHEHLRYYSRSSLSYLLARHGFMVTDMQAIPTHGGSFRTIAVPQPQGLNLQAHRALQGLHDLVLRASMDGAVYGIGATTRATPLIHGADLQLLVECVCEVSSSEKIGQSIPGTHIPILDEDLLFVRRPPHVLLLSWHLADSIVPKLRERGYQGKYIIPLPEPRITYGDEFCR